ncbi:hypothetical protein A5674_27075 [Mycobacterium malmoense]|uniref:hypothetical protein n=1 Tax=Mycobacterium malmoense TaxID=1780 RepID=UPI00080BE27A|nr:hypothetical protein [Mycobacterium malmoense]OCB21808.1 hypothetical protein A5674_27075 [Mycobacterium malmoense]
MNDPIKERAFAIRDHITRLHENLSPDPDDLDRFSVALATWDRLRLQLDRGQATPADERRFEDLTTACEDLSEKIGLGRVLTIDGGFLVGLAPERIINKTWQEAAEAWYG